MVENGGAKADDVALIGYRAMMNKKLVVINEYGLSFLLQWIIPFMPRRWVLKMGANLQKK